MTSMPSSLLERLKLQYPCRFSSQILNRILGKDELLALSKAGVLRQNRLHNEVLCQSCEDGHFTEVKYDNDNKPFIICNRENNVRTYLKPDELNIWRFDIPRFLELAAKELKIKGDVKNVFANDLWQIGTLQKDGKHFLVFYSRTNDLNSYSTFFDDFKFSVRAFVVFTNTETPPLKNERVKAVIPLVDIVKIKNKLLVWNTKLFQEYLLNALRQPKIKTILTKIPIKDARLDEQNYLLEVNNGEKIISFKSKMKGEGLNKETKQFKILYHLWDFRWEMKNDKNLLKGDFATLENLKTGSQCPTIEAVYQHIKRINNRFNSEGVPIKIEGKNGKYRLIINKS